MTEQEVSVESHDGVTLGGTLCQPETAQTLVIFVHGSGPLDRDQNSAQAPLNTFRDLSQACVAAGYATLRYDKRGVGASGGDFATLDQGDLLADLCAWVTWAQGFGRIILCGHSEGTALAAEVALTHDVAGLILICPYAVDGGTILLQQAARAERAAVAAPGIAGWVNRAAFAVMGGPVRRQTRLIKQILQSGADTIRVSKRDVPVRWLRSFIHSDPLQAHGQTNCPRLIITAGQDVQCDPEDGARIAGDAVTTKVLRFDDLSHILRPTKTPGVADYARQLGHPTDARIGEAMVAWLRGLDG